MRAAEACENMFLIIEGNLPKFNVRSKAKNSDRGHLRGQKYEQVMNPAENS